MQAARRVFEQQVQAYGGWDRLRLDTQEFQRVNTMLSERCEHVAVDRAQAVGVQRRAVCMVAQYRQLGLASTFNEQ